MLAIADTKEHDTGNDVPQQHVSNAKAIIYDKPGVKAPSILDQTQVALTPEEEAWLKAHPVLRLGFEVDWPPFERWTEK